MHPIRQDFLKILFGCVLACVVNVATATVDTAFLHISKYLVYTQYSNGDVIVYTDTAVAGCDDGFWISPADPGYKAVYAAVIAAKATNANVSIYADQTVLWPGSAGKYCRILGITSQ